MSAERLKNHAEDIEKAIEIRESDEAPCPRAPCPPRRKDLAWRHATEADLDRINYTIDLGRWRELPDLSNRAVRVLRWFAAGHRCGKHGYRGTRASYAAIGARIKRATHEPASRSTVIRGVDELVKKGYLTRARGRGDRVRQIAPGEYIREPIAVLTLTDKAIAIWTEEPPSHISLQVSKCNGYDLPSQLPGKDTSRGARPERAIEDASPIDTAAPSCPSAGSRADASDPATAPAVAADEPREARPVAPLAMLADLERPEDGARQAAGQRLRFTSATRPTTRAAAVAKLLATITRVTRRMRIGPALCSRAAAEIESRASVPPSGLDWDYWIARWPELTRSERDRFSRTEILPLLRPPLPVRALLRSPSAAQQPAPIPSGSRARGGQPEPHAASAAAPSLPEVLDVYNPYSDILARQLARLSVLSGDQHAGGNVLEESV